MPVAARPVAIVAGVLAALYVALFYTVRPVPGWLLRVYGGASSPIDRDGGLRVVVRTPSGAREVREIAGVAREDAGEVIQIVRAGGLEFDRVVESRIMEGLREVGVEMAHDRDVELALDTDRWQGPDGVPHEDIFLRGSSRKLLDDTIAAAHRARWALPSHTRIVYEHV